MSYLIDTNVVSEAMARRPSAEVMAWFESQAPSSLYFSVGTIAEIDYGVARLEVGPRRTRYQVWRDNLVAVSGRRILPVDLPVAQRWGEVRARSAEANRTMPIMDALIAATADVHELIVVTRNVRDFESWGGPVFNPWPAPPTRSA